MGRLLVIALWATTSLGAPAPSFTCSADNRKFEIWLTPERKTLVEIHGSGRTETQLTEPNLGAKAPPESGLHYFGFQPKGKTPYSRYLNKTLLRIRYYQKDGSSYASVDLGLDHHPLKLACTAHQVKVSVVEPGLHETAPARFGEIGVMLGGQIDGDGKTSPLSVLALESSLLRFFYSGEASVPGYFDEFAERLAPVLRKSAPSSMETLGRRLSAKERPFLDQMLEKARYKYTPESQRYADWVKEGLRRSHVSGTPDPDWALVQAGLTQFVSSTSFRAADLQRFFRTQVADDLSKLDPFDLLRITSSLKPDGERFVVDTWGKDRTVDYARAKEVYAFVRDMETNLDRPLKAEEKGVRSHFGLFVNAFSQLSRKPHFREPAVRRYLKERIVPRVNALTSQERKALLTPFSEDDRKAWEGLR